MSPIEILYAIGLVVAVALIAYLTRRNREFVRIVLEEKVMVLDKVIPVLERLEPVVPPEYKDEYSFLLGLLIEVRNINGVLASVPEGEAIKLFKSFKARMEGLQHG